MATKVKCKDCAFTQKDRKGKPKCYRRSRIKNDDTEIDCKMFIPKE